MDYQLRMARGLDALPQARAVREAVFVQEQGFHNEFDGVDPAAEHAALFDGACAVAVGRAYPDPAEPACWHIGRICVLPEYRGQHLGERIMRALEDRAAALGARRVQLSAQVQASGFYQKLGYSAQGEPYLDEHCPHIRMEKALGVPLKVHKKMGE